MEISLLHNLQTIVNARRNDKTEGRKKRKNNNTPSTTNVSPAPSTVNMSKFNKGDRLMVECTGSRIYEACYMFDSVLNQGMIWVNFDYCANKLTKAPTSCYVLILVTLVLIRKSKTPNYYQPGVIGTEMISSCCNRSRNRVETNLSELLINNEVPTKGISLENDKYNYLVTRNNMNFEKNANFAGNK